MGVVRGVRNGSRTDPATIWMARWNSWKRVVKYLGQRTRTSRSRPPRYEFQQANGRRCRGSQIQGAFVPANTENDTPVVRLQ
jgi:hypothetical protein